MAGEFIDINTQDGDTFRAYLSLPPRGKGPGIVLCHEIFGANATMRALADTYAAEGYVVALPDLYWREEPGLEFGYTSGDWQRAFALSQSYDFDLGVEDVAATLATLRARPEVESETTASIAAQQAATQVRTQQDEDIATGPIRRHLPGGTSVVGFSLGGRLSYLAACRLEGVSCAASFYGTGLEDVLDEAKNLRGRLVIHLPENDKFVRVEAQQQILSRFESSRNVEVYVYPRVDRGFSRRGTESYNRPASTIAHQRTMAALKREMGPYFNLSRLWDAHLRHALETKDIDKLMAGMVEDPVINHVPTRTGGTGREKVRDFYENHFIGKLPVDLRMTAISRTVGASQLIEEIVMSFTHSTVIDWLLPGVAPTNRYVELPMVAVVSYRGEKLLRLQTYWDQASVLVQIGRLESDALPVAGIECARKLINEDLPSNELIARTPV